MRFDPVSQSAAIVMIGNFNPAIFSPSWLSRVGAMSLERTDDAEIAVIHPQVSQFKVGATTYLVEENRFAIQSFDEPFVEIADILSVIFSKLSHTPVSAVAVNYDVSFAMDSYEQRNKLGRALAPLDPWGEWGKSLPSSDMTANGGLMNLTMREPAPPRRKSGYRGVMIEGAAQPGLSATVGIHMRVNDHCDAPSDAAGSAEFCTKWALDNFDESLLEAKAIVSGVMEFGARL